MVGNLFLSPCKDVGYAIFNNPMRGGWGGRGVVIVFYTREYVGRLTSF